MVAHGRVPFTTAEDGRVLDRLAGLERVISPDAVREILAECGLDRQRACPLSHEVMMWFTLAMVIESDKSHRQVFKASRRGREFEETPDRSALCQARQRLGVEPLRRLFARVVRPLATEEDCPAAFYRGMRLVGWDGSVYDVPDSEKNAAEFGYPQGGRGAGAFPQIRKVALVELGTHVEFAVEFGPLSTGENTLADRLIPSLPQGCLLLQDRNFLTYDRAKRLMAAGVHFLARMKKSNKLEILERLPDGSYLSKLYPSSWHRNQDRDGLLIRVVRYKIDDAQRGDPNEEHVLVTDLMDHAVYPALELIELYHVRWEQELVYDEQKTHLDPKRPTKPTHLRSQTPEGVHQEMYALSIAHFTIRALMYAAACQAGISPLRLSFTGCYQILKIRLPESAQTTPADLARWHAALLREMRSELLPPRANRINPRVVKQKIKKWAKKRPQHYAPDPLTQTFITTVVVLC